MAIAHAEETPTGLTIVELRELAIADKRELARWQALHSGWDEERPFLSRRVRDLPLAVRLALARDLSKSLAWEARERRRCADPIYFVTQYGSIQPEEGRAIPFDLWPEQVGALEAMVESKRLVVLKARQLGLTWLALHFAVWLMAFNPATPKARVLALSKIGADADALVERARKLVARLPPYLRPVEAYRWRDSNSRFVLKTGAEMRSLMGTVAAARSMTATLAILDEFAFYRNQQAGGVWSSVNPTLGERGRAIVISTGNGTAGDGAGFASLWRQAQEGVLRSIFLPNGVDPARRGEGWREAKRREFLTTEDFEAEYPETAEQAFAGAGSFKVYPQGGLDAALALGRRLEAHLPELIEASGFEWGIDWGDFQTFAVYLVELPGGGAFVFDELITAHTEPGKASELIVYRDPAGIPGATISFSAADKAPVGTNRTFARVLREAYNADPQRYPSKHNTIPFGVYKEGGGDRRGGTNTVGYIASLLDAAETFDGDPREAAGLLAIGPRCQTLASQMRNLERDAEKGKVRKPSLDPRHIERGDHGPDALVAAMARRAERWRTS